ncbi:histidine phosphatase superfamily [Histomonas meleagridis]|uniref:histidine phosphatase superfamily n=1 Tax=Histomonas meleagridis TaxID=135588 RepID=UPI00355A59AB|nr:histidine phosphatase superfamily [Histomonas meleagridis]KAH0796948.1 histidine phosphatase superfamily [Histomonas meleagridis]
MNFANGLYPNHGPLVINTADKNYDPWRRASAICPNLQERMEELKKPSYLSSIGLYNETLTKIMTDAYGTKWEHINDAATSARCQGFKLPPNITHKLIDAAVHLRTQQMLYVYRHESVYPLFFSFSAAEMLNEMISRVNGESLIKFFHWSAHDGNILAFLGYLGCEITQWPPYGSYIIVELRKSRNNKDYFLQFRYNGKLMKMPRFSGVKSVPFDMFRKFVEMKIPDMKENCGFNELNFAKLDVSLPEAI